MFQTKKNIIVASASPRRQQFFKDLGIDFQVLAVQKQKLFSGGNYFVPKQGVLGMFDDEARPVDGEKPEVYALRMAQQKLFDALNFLGIWKETCSLFSTASTFRNKELCMDLSYPLEKFLLNGFGGNIPKELENSLIMTADTIVCFGDLILGKPKTKEEALAMLQKLKGNTHTVITAVAFFDTANACGYCFYDRAEVQFMPWSADLLKAYADTGESLDKAGGYGINGMGCFLSSSIKGCADTVIGLPVAKCVEFLLWNTALTV